jgi:hypothetical protein
LKRAAAAALGILALGQGPVRGGPATAPIRFEEVAERSGLGVRHHTRVFSGSYADVLGTFTSGGAAVAVGDFDGDGLDDLFLTDSGAGQPSHLLPQPRALRLHRCDRSGPGGRRHDPRAIVSDAPWFDYDNDGRRDCSSRGSGPPSLPQRGQWGRFTDVSRRWA